MVSTFRDDYVPRGIARVHVAVELAVVRVHGCDDAADGADHVGVDGRANDHAADGVCSLQRRLRLHVSVPNRRP